ncbi:hypothetical protein DSO57_1011355 [Entomophthora muscae]|uniref:Uncharacterized protein n=1 Tax=Entomophthora muscae TaxID=34485 RepID=A0ACC2U5D5_9FUNG|nr:hypothetical protein DSO57_1011355 [Entomophthora muscae]
MEPPVTVKPMPHLLLKFLMEQTNKLFRIVSITFIGVIVTIFPTTSLWSLVVKLTSYLIKLAPILWWALPARTAACQFPDTDKPAAQGWFPDTDTISIAPPTAKVSHNTQGALDELPHDVTDGMGQSGCNVKLQAPSPNWEQCQFDTLVLFSSYSQSKPYVEPATVPPPGGLLTF